MNLLARIPCATHARRAVAKSLACGVLLALPACRIPPIRNAEAGPVLPGDYTAAANPGAAPLTASVAESSATLGIDEFYGDPLLTGLIRQAAANNRELKILEQEIEVARNEVLARRGAYLPLVTVVAGGGFEKSSRYTREGAVEDQLQVAPDRFFPNPLPNTALGLDFLWRLDIWRALRNARDAAQQRYFAAAERRNAFVTRLVADVAENYYRLMALDKRLETLDQTIALQQQSLDNAKARKEAGRGTELPVQRFQAEVRKNQSEKLIATQEVVEAENRVNVLVNRYPQAVERASAGYFDVTIAALGVGLPSQLLRNRPDVRQAERELQASGLDVLSARARFYPDVTITAGLGTQAFSPRYLFMTPEALVASVAGGVVAPLINRNAIKAEYLSANARQLEAVYNYQRVVLVAFTEVINRVSMAENYRKSLEIKRQQLESLETSVEVATKLFQGLKVEYVEVLLAQRDLLEARTALIEIKRQQLTAVVNAYQALGGGDLLTTPARVVPAPVPVLVPLPVPVPAPVR